MLRSFAFVDVAMNSLDCGLQDVGNSVSVSVVTVVRLQIDALCLLNHLCKPPYAQNSRNQCTCKLMDLPE